MAIRTKADFKRALPIVRGVVKEWDPSALFGAGAPDDEHDREVYQVIGRVGEIHSAEDADRVLRESFGGWLEASVPSSTTSSEAGRKLFEALQREGLAP